MEIKKYIEKRKQRGRAFFCSNGIGIVVENRSRMKAKDREMRGGGTRGLEGF